MQCEELTFQTLSDPCKPLHIKPQITEIFDKSKIHTKSTKTDFSIFAYEV